MKYTALITVAAMAASVQAGYFNEAEGNNTLFLANSIGSYDAPGGGAVVNGAISTGDVDWFSFTLDNAASMSVFALFSASNSDGVMQIVDAGGTVIAFDDDSGIDLMPAIQLQNLAAGLYYIGISGFGDVDSGSVGTSNIADGLLVTGGQHQEEFGYKLSVGFTIVPAPGSMTLLGMGGALMIRRRRA